MAILTGFPLNERSDGPISTDVEFNVTRIFESSEGLVDFSSATFQGSLLDEQGGVELFPLTMNTPSNDGKISGSLNASQTATLADQEFVWYFIQMTVSGEIFPIVSGRRDVEINYKPGT